jgi:hypothetical protein
MDISFLFIQMHNGLVTVDVPADSAYIQWALGFWLVMFLVNFILGLIKRLPYV